MLKHEQVGAGCCSCGFHGTSKAFAGHIGGLRGKAIGALNGRWNNQERRITSEGYVAIRVPIGHPHAWGPETLKRFRYAYEHHVVIMVKIGRPLQPHEVVHHINGNRADNRPENLQVEARSEHAREHSNILGARDSSGRFKIGSIRRRTDRKGADPSEWPDDLQVQQFPQRCGSPALDALPTEMPA